MNDEEILAMQYAPFHWPPKKPLTEWLALCFGIFLLAGYMAYALREEYVRIEARERARLADQCKVVSMNIERHFSGISTSLSGIVKELPQWRRMPDGAKLAAQHLRALKNAMPGVLTLLVIDSNGTVRASDKPELVGQSAAERNYFQVVLKSPGASTLYVRPPLVSGLGNFTMNLTRMVAGSKGEFDGLVIAALDAEGFKILLNSVLYRSDVRASLIHGDGVPFLMAPRSRDIAGLDLVMPGSFFSRHLESAQDASVFEGPISPGGEARMIAMQTVQPAALSMDRPMVIVVDRGLQFVFANWYRDLAKSLTLFGFLTLLAASSLWMHQRRQRAAAINNAQLELYRHETIETLRQSEDKFRNLTELSSDWYWEQDEQFRFVPLSGQLNEKTRTANEGHIGKTRWEMGAENLTEADWQAHQSALKSHQEFRDFEMLRTDLAGVPHWVSSSGRPIFDSGGNFCGYRGVAKDITERKLTHQALKAREERFQILFDRASEGIVIVSLGGDLIAINQAFANMHGYTVDEMKCLKLSDLDTATSFEQVPARIKRILAGERQTFEAENFHKDGHVFPLEVSSSMILVDGAPMIQSFTRDISERRETQVKLLLAASVVDHAREGIAITDPSGTIVEINQSFTRITGYSREDSIGQNAHILSSGRHDQAFYKALWNALLVQGHWSGEIWNRRKSGEVYAELLTVSAIRDARGDTRQYVALFSDITAIKEQQRQLEHTAHFDALTSLPNRLLLSDRLQQAMTQALRRGQQLAVAYLDLDGFKNVNDKFGHDMGDQLLILVAAAMKSALREGDTLARLGGDEFVAVLIDMDGVANCAPMLTRLLDAAAAPVLLGEAVLKCSASIGVTFYPQAHDMEADQLLRQADQAMYQAKLAGKNRYHIFDASHDSSVRVHHEKLERIRLALARGEFVLHYQPKVNMHSGKVVGAEALIRWQHPQKGLLAPASFLPAIEDHPLAVEVGEWVIDTVLTQLALWQDADLNLTVSINIGARQLQQSDFVERLQAILARHRQVSPARLELEVLETSALADMVQVSQIIEHCHEMGVKFALDDFGTGYSSLTYLKRLRVAQLKIDQSFVRDMLDDPDDLAILEGVIGLAAAFKREVIAEGVETVEHGTALLHLGCQLAQGYGIARPMPGEHLPAWAASWRPDAAWCAVLSPGDASRSEKAQACA
jgi:diguanylate cyclase (GGDEF)-like protein/PAS domain S-box-containing protein